MLTRFAVVKALGKKENSMKNWIQGAIKKPGALRKSLGIKADHKIPLAKLEAAAHKPGKLGQRARLALTFKRMRRGG